MELIPSTMGMYLENDINLVTLHFRIFSDISYKRMFFLFFSLSFENIFEKHYDQMKAEQLVLVACAPIIDIMESIDLSTISDVFVYVDL